MLGSARAVGRAEPLRHIALAAEFAGIHIKLIGKAGIADVGAAVAA
jgi:hypothetical protein